MATYWKKIILAGDINDTQAIYAAGTAYSLTAVAALLDFGTTDPALTISRAGTYLLLSRVRLDYSGATFAANRTVTLKLRNASTASDVGNSSCSFVVPIITTLTYTADVIVLPAVVVTVTQNTILQLWGSIDVIPTAGSIQAMEASIVAIQLS
jgi:hypothetical protein